MDLLSRIYQKQKELYEFYKERRGWYKNTPVDKQLITFTIAMMDEAFEFLSLLNWKPWKNPKPLNKVNKELALEELIDLLHFWMQLVILLGYEPEDILKKYEEKHAINQKRQEGKTDRAEEYYSVTVDENDLRIEIKNKKEAKNA